MKISEMQSLAYSNACEKGFHDKEEGLDPNVIPEKLMLIVSEAAEALEVYREGHPMLPSYRLLDQKPVGFDSELADIVIRVADLAGHLGINLERAIVEKMTYNARRPHMHGGKKC